MKKIVPILLSLLTAASVLGSCSTAGVETVAQTAADAAAKVTGVGAASTYKYSGKSPK